MSDIALKIPLSLLAFGRRAQSHHTADPRIERLGDPLDGASLARSVAALEEDHDLQTFVANPFVKLDQFDLQASEFLIVVAVFAQAQELRRFCFVGNRSGFASHDRLPSITAERQKFITLVDFSEK